MKLKPSPIKAEESPRIHEDAMILPMVFSSLSEAAAGS